MSDVSRSLSFVTINCTRKDHIADVIDARKINIDGNNEKIGLAAIKGVMVQFKDIRIEVVNPELALELDSFYDSK